MKIIDTQAISMILISLVKKDTKWYRNINIRIPAESMRRELILKQILTCSFAVSEEPFSIELATNVKRVVAIPSAGIKVNYIKRVRIVAAPSASSP